MHLHVGLFNFENIQGSFSLTKYKYLIKLGLTFYFFKGGVCLIFTWKLHLQEYKNIQTKLYLLN